MFVTYINGLGEEILSPVFAEFSITANGSIRQMLVVVDRIGRPCLIARDEATFQVK